MKKLYKASILIIRCLTFPRERDFRRDFAYNFLLNERYGVCFATGNYEKNI